MSPQNAASFQCFREVLEDVIITAVSKQVVWHGNDLFWLSVHWNTHVAWNRAELASADAAKLSKRINELRGNTKSKKM